MNEFDTVLIIFSSIVSCCAVCFICFCICEHYEDHSDVTPEEHIINNDVTI